MRSLTLSDLARIAAAQGLTLHMAHLEGALGAYDHAQRRVYFEWDLSPAEQVSVIAHELGHAYYGHDCDSKANERQADAYASNLLINPEHYAEAEQHSHDAYDMAEMLGVTKAIIHAYRDHHLQRLGHRTYGIRHRGRLTPKLARTLT